MDYYEHYVWEKKPYKPVNFITMVKLLYSFTNTLGWYWPFMKLYTSIMMNVPLELHLHLHLN